MNRRRSVPRALLAALLTTLVLGSGIVPELLDRDVEQRTTLEAPHDAADCPGAHDHRVCTQINATPMAAGPGRASPPPPSEGSAWTMAVRLDALTLGIAPTDHPTRAPPA